MKIILLLVCSLFLVKARSQCAASDIFIQNIVVAPIQTGGGCTVKFDATFTMQDNNGNKYIFLHAWPQASYPNYFQCSGGNTTLNGSISSPKAADLGNEFLTIGINNNATNPSLLTVYTPDIAVPVTPVDSIRKQVLPDGRVIFYLFGVTTTVPMTCGTPTVIIADLWSSQSANAQRAHCVNCGIMSSSGFIRALGLVNCATSTFLAALTNNTNAAITGTYRVFADINGDKYFNPAIDTLIGGPASFSIPAGIGMTTAISGPVPVANRNQDLFLVLTITSGAGGGASRVVLLSSTLCTPLPVTFSSFSGHRINRTMVALKWETFTEINNSGFVLQRSKANNNWEDIAFIPSQAMGGTSTTLLSYTYNDFNDNRGISLYRIVQVDIDGKLKFSEIRSVRGFGQTGMTLIYPNPSYNGSTTIVFEDAFEGKRDISVIDMSGRIIRQWRSVSTNTLQVDGLKPGIYSIHIIVPQTGESFMEKLVVAKE